MVLGQKSLVHAIGFSPKIAMKNWDKKNHFWSTPKVTCILQCSYHVVIVQLPPGTPGNSHSVLRFCTTDQKTITFTVMHADFQYVSWFSDMRIVTGWWFGTFVIFPYIENNME